MKSLICKIGIIFILITSIVFPCLAQQTKQLQFGVITGLNLSNLYSNDAISNLNAGFNAGGFLRMAVSNTIAIEPELYLSTKGTSVVYNSLSAVIPLESSSHKNAVKFATSSVVTKRPSGAFSIA